MFEGPGGKAFNACNVKVVQFNRFVYRVSDYGARVLSSTPSQETRTYAGSGAVLHCPRTEDDRVTMESQRTNHGSDDAALASLRSIAGKLLCQDCQFAKMTPVQVSVHRAELARAEADRLDAYRALRMAQEEIQKLGELPRLPPSAAGADGT